jgi:hypothetical protein
MKGEEDNKRPFITALGQDRHVTRKTGGVLLFWMYLLVYLYLRTTRYVYEFRVWNSFLRVIEISCVPVVSV